MTRILFACTGNGGRSQTAAAFARLVAPKGVDVLCAGDRRQEPAEAAVRVMREIGLDLAPHLIRKLDEVATDPFDVVVTLCNHALEMCPVFPGAPARIHWPLTDPAKAPAVDATYRSVRDDIRHRVESLFRHGFVEAIQQVRSTLGSLLDNLTDGVLAHDADRRDLLLQPGRATHHRASLRRRDRERLPRGVPGPLLRRRLRVLRRAPAAAPPRESGIRGRSSPRRESDATSRCPS